MKRISGYNGEGYNNLSLLESLLYNTYLVETNTPFSCVFYFNADNIATNNLRHILNNYENSLVT